MECTYLRCLDTKMITVLNGSDGQRQTGSGLNFNEMISSAACQFSKAIVSTGEETGREQQREYKRKGNDHEDGNGARSVHGPPPITLARSLGNLPATVVYCRRLPLSFWALWANRNAGQWCMSRHMLCPERLRGLELSIPRATSWCTPRCFL